MMIIHVARSLRNSMCVDQRRGCKKDIETRESARVTAAAPTAKCLASHILDVGCSVGKQGMVAK